jgi:hypothetical protein
LINIRVPIAILPFKKPPENVADSIAVRGAETPVTHPQGEGAKILKMFECRGKKSRMFLWFLGNFIGYLNKGIFFLKNSHNVVFITNFAAFFGKPQKP